MDKELLLQIVNKLDGKELVEIILGILASGTICYACYSNASIEFSLDEKKVCINSKGDSNVD